MRATIKKIKNGYLLVLIGDDDSIWENDDNNSIYVKDLAEAVTVLSEFFLKCPSN